MVGIFLQVVFLIRKLCDAIDILYSEDRQIVPQDFAFHPFGNRTARFFIAGIFQILESLISYLLSYLSRDRDSTRKIFEKFQSNLNLQTQGLKLKFEIEKFKVENLEK